MTRQARAVVIGGGIAHFLERAFDRMPILADLGIRRVVRGAIPYTPDGPPLVGPAPGFRNVWMACGSSIGIAWGGGTGKLLADTMVHGEAEYAFRSMDPRRFGAYATHDYIVMTRVSGLARLLVSGAGFHSGRPVPKFES